MKKSKREFCIYRMLIKLIATIIMIIQFFCACACMFVHADMNHKSKRKINFEFLNIYDHASELSNPLLAFMKAEMKIIEKKNKFGVAENMNPL